MFDAIGGIIGGILGASSAAKDRKLQKQFAKNGIQWRAADARKAGIHPLAALGASTAQYMPVGDGGLGSAVAQGVSALGNMGSKALEKEQVQSAIKVNEAQAKLLEAQTVSTLHSVASPLGAIGGKVALPNPQKQKIPHGWSESNPIPSTVFVRTEDGEIVRMLNPALAMDFGEAGSTAGRLALQRGRAQGTAGYTATDKKAVKALPRNPSRGDRVIFNGTEYVFHPRHGWRPVK